MRTEEARASGRNVDQIISGRVAALVLRKAAHQFVHRAVRQQHAREMPCQQDVRVLLLREALIDGVQLSTSPARARPSIAATRIGASRLASAAKRAEGSTRWRDARERAERGCGDRSPLVVLVDVRERLDATLVSEHTECAIAAMRMPGSLSFSATTTASPTRRRRPRPPFATSTAARSPGPPRPHLRVLTRRAPTPVPARTRASSICRAARRHSSTSAPNAYSASRPTRAGYRRDRRRAAAVRTSTGTGLGSNAAGSLVEQRDRRNPVAHFDDESDLLSRDDLLREEDVQLAGDRLELNVILGSATSGPAGSPLRAAPPA